MRHSSFVIFVTSVTKKRYLCKNMNCSTDFLYADSSFVSGMGRTLDLGATMDDYNYAPAIHLADLIALSADWNLVTSELHSSLLDGVNRLSPHDRQRLMEY